MSSFLKTPIQKLNNSKRNYIKKRIKYFAVYITKCIFA